MYKTYINIKFSKEFLISFLFWLQNIRHTVEDSKKTDTSLRVMEKKFNYILTSILLLL